MLLERLCEAQSAISKRPLTYFSHVYTMFSFGFIVLFISLDYSRLACLTGIANNRIFWIYLVFTASLFIGACLTNAVVKLMSHSRIIFVCCGISSSCLWLLSVIQGVIPLSFVYLFIGLSSGLAVSTTVHSFLLLFPQTAFCLTHSLYAFHSLGALVGSLLFESTTEPSCPDKVQSMHHVLGQNQFALRSFLRLDVICFVFASMQIPLMYLLLSSKIENDSEQHVREDYDDIEHEASITNDTLTLKLVLLSSGVACIATVLFAVFPFLIFSHSDGSMTHCQIFCIFFLWGRVVGTITSDRVAPYFYLGLSILGCGAACCALIFDGGLLLGSVLFGFFLSSFHPSLVTYIRHTLVLTVDTELILLSGSSFGHLIFPIFLSVSTPSHSRVFTTFFFFSSVVLVFLYVFMLNVQAQSERTKASQDKVKLFIDRFFSGENLLKRTRSIRPLISRLRPNSYKRFRERRALRNRVPTIEVTSEPTPPRLCEEESAEITLME